MSARTCDLWSVNADRPGSSMVVNGAVPVADADAVAARHNASAVSNGAPQLVFIISPHGVLPRREQVDAVLAGREPATPPEPSPPAPPVAPGARFLHLVRTTPRGHEVGRYEAGTVVAEAAVYSGGTAILQWLTDPQAIEIYPSEDAMRHTRESSGRAEFRDGPVS